MKIQCLHRQESYATWTPISASLQDKPDGAIYATLSRDWGKMYFKNLQKFTGLRAGKLSCFISEYKQFKHISVVASS